MPGAVASQAPGGDIPDVPSPTLESLADDKRELLVQMRARVDALPPDAAPHRRHDLVLKRFLAHGKWDLEQALELFLQTEAWRRENGADEILPENPTGERLQALPLDLALMYPYSTDREGRQIGVMTIGMAPWWRPLFEPIGELYRAQIWIAEWLDAQVARTAAERGEWRERGVVLIDLSRFDWAFFQGMVTHGRVRPRVRQARKPIKNYPGLVDRAYVLNAPGFVGKAFAIVKLFLSEALVEKVCVVQSEEDRAAMLLELGPENVPRSLGGLSDRPSTQLPECLQLPVGGWSAVLEAWRPEEITVAARSQHEIVRSMPAGTRLTWQWALVQHSIRFEVAQRRQGGGDFEVLSGAEHRFEESEDPVCGGTPAPEGGGDVRLVWDNRSSKMRSKTLLLRITVA